MSCQSLYCLKSKDVFVKVITCHYIVVHDLINIMVEIIEPEGVLCKMLRGNPYHFETHKTDFHNWLHGSIEGIMTTLIL
jgi:hypothetical protein